MKWTESFPSWFWALLALIAVLFGLPAFGQDSTYTTSNYTEQGGARTVIGGTLDIVSGAELAVESGGGLAVESGGALDVESGGSLKLAGTAITSSAEQLNAITGPLEAANNSGGAYTAGTLVYISGYDATNNMPEISKADGDNLASLAQFVCIDAISDSSTGTIDSGCLVTGLDTSGVSAAGDPVYLSATAGAFGAAALTGASQISQVVGYVKVKNASTGVVYFDPQTPSVIKIGTDAIMADAITTTEIVNSAVTNAKLAGSIADAKLSSSLAKRPALPALGALYYSGGRPADDEICTIAGRKYEIDSDGDFPQTAGDVQIDTSGNANIDDDITDIATAINGDGSATYGAVGDTTNDVVWLVADTAGSAGNSITLTEGMANCTPSDSTLAGGADAAVAAVACYRHTITTAEAGGGFLYFSTGLTSIEQVHVTWEDAGVEAVTGATVAVSGGTITITEGNAWANGDILNVLAIGTE